MFVAKKAVTLRRPDNMTAHLSVQYICIVCYHGIPP
jgi:hypothetical protein